MGEGDQWGYRVYVRKDGGHEFEFADRIVEKYHKTGTLNAVRAFLSHRPQPAGTLLLVYDETEDRRFVFCARKRPPQPEQDVDAFTWGPSES